jgi:hypothetical protein
MHAEQEERKRVELDEKKLREQVREEEERMEMLCIEMLTYADVCRRMPTYADVC